MRTQKFTFLLLFSFVIFSPHSQASPPESVQHGVSYEKQTEVQDNELYTWLRTKSHQPRGVAVLAHGLNFLPSKMDSMGTVLNEMGIDVLRLSLTGHRKDLAAFKKIQLENWLSDTSLSYAAARERADQLGVPLYFVGFSLGALLNIDLMHQPRDPLTPRYDRMILLAPAISVHSRARWVKILSLFGKDVLIPSFSHPDYRANEGTSVAAYLALFESLDRIGDYITTNIPTLVIIDPKDELVDPKGIEKIIQKNHLSEWKMMYIDNSQSELKDGKYHHLIVDRPSLGSATWEKVKTAIQSHL